ncbi:MAG: uracil-DNA glycosylase family protein [Bacteroidota bacterium]
MSGKNKASQLLHHFDQLLNNLPSLPPEVAWLLPYKELPETAQLTKLFLNKYYNDENPRTLVLGINPGRFGAGITNVAFTDPLHLEQFCGIKSSFHKRAELSAVFIYKVIAKMGGPALFYQKFFVNSVVPFGFVKAGVNYNYYDDKILQNAMEPFIQFHIENLLEIGMNKEVCFCLGTGKNFKYLNKLNQKEKYFDRVVPLAHPRYIMQYKRKRLDQYLNEYVEAFK